MVKDRLDSERWNRQPPRGLLFSISSKGSFICTPPKDGIAHMTTYVTPVVEHCLEQEIIQWVGPPWRIRFQH